MASRICASCKQEFGPLRPPVEPVALRELEAGRQVPRLRIVAHGSLCAACARQTITQARRRARP